VYMRGPQTLYHHKSHFLHGSQKTVVCLVPYYGSGEGQDKLADLKVSVQPVHSVQQFNFQCCDFEILKLW
jgi:hypothetical protein